MICEIIKGFSDSCILHFWWVEADLEKDRGFYFDMADSPYYITESQESLENIIESLNEIDVKENCRQILEFYGTNESGNAAKMIAKRIVEWIEKNK